MGNEGDIAVGLDLLEPGQTPAMPVQGGTHVHKSVAVDILDLHVGTAPSLIRGVVRRQAGRPPLGEVIVMADPQGIARERSRLFEPCVGDHHVVPTVTVDVAYSQSMAVVVVSLVCASGRAGIADDMENP